MMNSTVEGSVLVTINTEKEGDLGSLLATQGIHLKELVNSNRELFRDCTIDYSEVSVLKIREVARINLIKESDILELTKSCVKSDMECVKRLAEKCFMEIVDGALLKHFVMCQKFAVNTYGIEKAASMLLDGIKDLGEATSSHFILTMEV